MSKNLVYISALDGFADDFPLGIETWYKYCERLGVNFQLQTEYDRYVERLYSRINGSWYPWFCEYLHNEDWDKVLIVDADTMIRWNAPDIFEVATADVNVVKDSSPLTYGAIPHLNQWRKDFDVTMPPQNYFNAGFLVLSREAYHKIALHMGKYFDYAQTHNTHSWEQTPVNIEAWNNYGDRINYLPKIWNDMIGFNYEEGDLSYINRSFVWHFTGNGYQIDKAKRKRLMEDAYKVYCDRG